MGKTSIEWTDASWNPIVGCTEVSPGCANCYAARLASTRLRNHPDYRSLAIHRSEKKYGTNFPGRRVEWTGMVRFLEERLEEPLHWRTPRRIFVCDMGDLFHAGVHGDWIDQIIHIMDQCPQHTFQILTKRAQRMHDLLRHYPMAEKKNVWLGVSVENQHFADERIPLLLDTPAAVRFLSCEPLLSAIGVSPYFVFPVGADIARLHWVICGGESGPHARAMHPDWARSLRDQCQAAGVPFFFKQWGEWAGCGIRMGKKAAGRLLDGREWNEFPSTTP